MTRRSTTSTDGTTITYQRSGLGTPLVLVHGTAADHRRWAPVLPSFEQRFTVCAVDRRGRGSSGDTAGYSVEREFDDVAAVVESWVSRCTCSATPTGHSAHSRPRSAPPPSAR